MDTAVSTPLTARRGGPLQGRARVPGDKSISHRALILGALTVGESTVAGLLEGEDVLHTAEAMRALGAKAGARRRRHLAHSRRRRRRLCRSRPARSISAIPAPAAGWRSARWPASPVTATFDGDASLRKRPMRRVLDPLEQMGARVIEAAEGGRLPLTLQGARDPIPIVYELPVPSAQLKSAVLLAGLAAPGETTVIEAEATRDHTERMLKHFGAKLVSKPHGEHGRRITLQGQPELEPANVVVPADPSSAAFPLVAALLVPGSDLIARSGDDQSAAHRALYDAAGDGRQDRGGGDARRRRRGGRRSARDRVGAQGRRGAGRARAVDDRRISDPGGGRRRLPKARRACAA